MYLNGRLIGPTAFLTNFTEGYRDKERIYAIPERLLHFNKKNVLAARVYDYIREGGVWKESVCIDSIFDIYKQTTDFTPPAW